MVSDFMIRRPYHWIEKGSVVLHDEKDGIASRNDILGCASVKRFWDEFVTLQANGSFFTIVIR